MNLCECDNEERDRGVGPGVNDTMLFETDLLPRKGKIFYGQRFL
jgi:hypothetical protein